MCNEGGYNQGARQWPDSHFSSLQQCICRGSLLIKKRAKLLNIYHSKQWVDKFPEFIFSKVQPLKSKNLESRGILLQPQWFKSHWLPLVWIWTENSQASLDVKIPDLLTLRSCLKHFLKYYKFNFSPWINHIGWLECSMGKYCKSLQP